MNITGYGGLLSHNYMENGYRLISMDMGIGIGRHILPLNYVFL